MKKQKAKSKKQKAKSKKQKAKSKKQNRVLQPEIKPTADDFVHSATHAALLKMAVCAGGVHDIVRTRRRPRPRPSRLHPSAPATTRASVTRLLRRRADALGIRRHFGWG